MGDTSHTNQASYIWLRWYPIRKLSYVFFFEMNKRSDIVVYPLGNGLHYSGRSGGYFQEGLIYFLLIPLRCPVAFLKMSASGRLGGWDPPSRHVVQELRTLVAGIPKEKKGKKKLKLNIDLQMNDKLSELSNNLSTLAFLKISVVWTTLVMGSQVFQQTRRQKRGN